jgi:DNA (cytosine-5)-methyltransferase 1
MELDSVLADLELEGYAARTFHIGAVGVNAPHRRMRVWIVAHSEGDRTRGKSGEVRRADGRPDVGLSAKSDDPDSDAPDAVDHFRQPVGSQQDERGMATQDKQGDGWSIPWIEVATRLCRVDDGLPAWIHARRVARLKALGNAIVPQVAYQIIKAIAEIERGMK